MQKYSRDAKIGSFDSIYYWDNRLTVKTFYSILRDLFIIGNTVWQIP